MLEPKYVPFLTSEVAKTEHGITYIVLSKDAPEDLRREYMKAVEKNDRRAANGEPIIKY